MTQPLNNKCCEKCAPNPEGLGCCVWLGCPCHTTPKNSESWEVEFDKVICPLGELDADHYSPSRRNIIKDFIRQLLQERSQEGGIDQSDMDWINECVDSHKMIRAESTRDRVKLLMMAAMSRCRGRSKDGNA